MKNQSTIINSLKSGKADKEIILKFITEAKKQGRLSACAMLSLNLPSYFSSYSDEYAIKPHPIIQSATQSLCSLLHILIESAGSRNELSDEAILAVIALRDANIRHMQTLSAYADRFTVYEYVLNRQEHRFSNKTLPDGYTDEEETQKILELLNGIQDSSERQSILVQLVEQLPMRMTKKRFFQILSEGFSVYKGSEEQTVQDLVYMLRTGALLEETQGMNSDYKMLSDIAKTLAEADYSNLDQAAYEVLYQNAQAGLEELNRQMDLVMTLQEVLNELTVMALTDAQKSDEQSACLSMIEKSLSAFETSSELSEEELMGFEQLEGVQEYALTAFMQYATAASEYMLAYPEKLQQSGYDHDFIVIEQISRLLSSSRFAALNIGEENTTPASEEYLAKVYLDLYKELNDQFKKLPRIMNRAIMAKLLTMLPLFLRDYQELEEYILGSLTACTDEAEKIACLEILDELLLGE